MVTENHALLKVHAFALLTLHQAASSRLRWSFNDPRTFIVAVIISVLEMKRIHFLGFNLMFEISICILEMYRWWLLYSHRTQCSSRAGTIFLTTVIIRCVNMIIITVICKHSNGYFNWSLTQLACCAYSLATSASPT
jgi:hypothetical protein